VTRTAETRVHLKDISVSRQADASIAVVGGPNSGKSTLFNRLTGLRQRIGNYPGVTVERHVGTLKTDDRVIELIDLPGTHGLSAHSFEEQIAVDVIFGRMEGTQPPDGILAVVDATNLYQGLYLVQQLLDLERPVVVALTMWDAAKKSGLSIDVGRLTSLLGGVTICPVVATTGEGINALRNALVGIVDEEAPTLAAAWPELSAAAASLAENATVPLRLAEIERLLVDGPAGANRYVLDCLGPHGEAAVNKYREELFGNEPPLAMEARKHGFARSSTTCRNTRRRFIPGARA
jgi:ferrous iron transport protein B